MNIWPGLLAFLGSVTMAATRAQHEAGDYVRWFVEHAFVVVPAQAIVGQHLATFQQIPAAAEARLILGRTGHGEAEEPTVEQLAKLHRA